MLVFGVTNRISKYIFLFMWEYDSLSEYDALEEANFFSQVFGIDIYISESSPSHYHIISFDLLNKDTVNRIQNFSVHHGDYKSLNETVLYDDRPPYNALRIGNKGKKQKPKFLKVFYAKDNTHLKSLGHLKLYQNLCSYPSLPQHLKRYGVHTNVQICSYNTGIGAKPKHVRDLPC